MPKTKIQKQEISKNLAEKLKTQQGIVFVDYKGLNVGDMTELRATIKENEGNLTVTKKTILSRVLKEKGIDINLKEMKGQIAVIFAFGDSIAPLQALHTFAKVHENVKILGGYLENEIQSASAMIAIAQLPSRNELLAEAVGSIAAPMSGFVRVLNGNVKGLVMALNAIAQKK
ncbi:MAG: 50S ribosomal protein L10 [Patescibacteria group bacterium]|nr:50S ribosomal protein L10 [Patescibacteria group bacterium]